MTIHNNSSVTIAHKGPGRPSKPPRPVVNKKRGGRYDIVDGTKREHLNTTDYASAIKAVGAYLYRKNTGIENRPERIYMREIFSHPSNCDRYLSPGLARFWSNRKLADVDYDNCRAYMEYRMTKDGNEGRIAKTSTVFSELTLLRTMIKKFCNDRHVDPVPEVYRPKVPNVRRPFVRVGEVDRLLMSAKGNVWDAGDQRMVKPSIEGKKVKDYDHIYRLILICIYTGSRVNVVMEAKWHDDGQSSWIDLDAGRFYRRGSEEVEHLNKRRTPVRMTSTLIDQAKEWRKKDLAAGCQYVLHRPSGDKLTHYNDDFGLVRKASGLNDNITIRVLRSSCAIWQMEGGVTLEQAADFLGNTAKVLSASYDHYAPEFSFAAADALDSRAY